MRKLIQGIVDFRERLAPSYSETFARLSLGQKPDVLFIGCSDSRVVPNLFASTQPGDLFVIRNVGNMVAPCEAHGVNMFDRSEAAAIEYAVEVLNVTDIVICGHSECGATIALLDQNRRLSPNLKSWLRHGLPSVFRFRSGETLDPALSQHNQLSQLNVLQQLEHMRSYPIVQNAVKEGRLRLHAWWFNISKAEVEAYDSETNRFIPIDRALAERMLQSIGGEDDGKEGMIPWQMAQQNYGACCTQTQGG